MSDSRKIPVTNRATGETEYLDRPGNTKPQPDGEGSYAGSVRGTSSSPSNYDQYQGTPDNAAAEPQRTSSLQAAKADGEPARATNKPKSGEKIKTRRRWVDNIEQFIAYAYSRKGKRLTLKGSEAKRLARSPKLEPAAIVRLLPLSTEDVLLAVPRQLLLVAREVVGYPGLREALRAFVQWVLLAHPIFERGELTASIRNLPEAPPLSVVLGTVAATDAATLEGRIPQLKSSAFDELRTNAVYTLAVWLADRRELRPSTVSAALYTALWSDRAKQVDSDTDRLRLLTEIRDVVGVGIASAEFQKRATEQEQLVTRAEQKVAAAREEAEALKLQLQEAQQAISRLENELRCLEQRRQEESNQSEIRQLHLQDDMERLRTRLLRRLKADITLLDEGLYALRLDPPKIHVMDDHVERVLDALRGEAKRLETGE